MVGNPAYKKLNKQPTSVLQLLLDLALFCNKASFHRCIAISVPWICTFAVNT